MDYDLAMTKGSIFVGLIGLYDKYISMEYSKINFASSASFAKMAALSLTTQKLMVYQS